jgi:hypothetical protein
MKEKQITDLYLVAALLSYGFECGEVDRSNPNRQRFRIKSETKRVFVKDGAGAVVKELTLDQVEDAYINRTLILLPSYPGTLRDLKYQVHSYRNDDSK